jgi:guanosine-3',5'-bis(diphosphate) 3'-pyrophosphohydrolase
MVVLQAAILHDTMEDTQTVYTELLDRFGKEVADVVAEVTDDKSLPKEQRKELQVTHAPHASRQAALVKLADKICNLRDIAASPPSGWSLQRQRDYFDWAKRVVDRLPPVSDPLSAAFAAAHAARP